MNPPAESTALNDWIEQVLKKREDLHQRRARRVVRVLDPTHLEIDGRRFINFASNDYLGLTHHPEVTGAAARALAECGAGSGASPLVTGYTPLHASAETALARWKQTEAAVLLPSGYQANHAVIQTFSAMAVEGRRPVRFLVDRLVHASLIDAVRASRAEVRVFPHNHLGKLERLLDRPGEGRMQVVVTESIFSMDGDACDLPGLAALKRKRPFVLLLDEAHGSGVYGAGGAGYAAEAGLAEQVDVVIVTFSKAMGQIGGAVCGSHAFCDAIVNFGRAYIYSTSLPPSAAAGVEAAISVMLHEPDRQARLRALARRVREGLGRRAIAIPPGDSPIIPVDFGEESAALTASGRLASQELFIPAIRPPTVPKGTSRLRVTLCCEHTDAEIELLINALTEVATAEPIDHRSVR